MHPKTYLRVTHYLWGFYILLICFFILFSNQIPFASTNYFQGAINWIAAKPLYSSTNPTFLYFPQTAVFYAALIKVPTKVYEVSWRILTLGLLWYGIFRFSKLNPYGKQPQFFFITSLITMLLGLSAVLIGQLDLIVVDGMLLTTVEILDQRWWFVAFYLIGGLSLNPAMLIMFVLIRIIYRRLFYRALILIFISFIIPFLLQDTHYVWEQYSQIHVVIRPIKDLNLQWSQLFSITGHLGIIIPRNMQTAITFISGVTLFTYYIKMKNRFSTPQFCVFLYFIASIFLMLFNPHTALSDYIILAPVMGFFLSVAIHKKITWGSTFLIIFVLGILLQMLAGFFVDPMQISWIAPLVTVLLFVIGLLELPYMEIR